MEAVRRVQANTPALGSSQYIDLVAQGTNLHFQGRTGLEAGAESDQEEE